MKKVDTGDMKVVELVKKTQMNDPKVDSHTEPCHGAVNRFCQFTPKCQQQMFRVTECLSRPSHRLQQHSMGRCGGYSSHNKILSQPFRGEWLSETTGWSSRPQGTRHRERQLGFLSQGQLHPDLQEWRSCESEAQPCTMIDSVSCVPWVHTTPLQRGAGASFRVLFTRQGKTAHKRAVSRPSCNQNLHLEHTSQKPCQPTTKTNGGIDEKKRHTCHRSNTRTNQETNPTNHIMFNTVRWIIHPHRDGFMSR